MATVRAGFVPSRGRRRRARQRVWMMALVGAGLLLAGCAHTESAVTCNSTPCDPLPAAGAAADAAAVEKQSPPSSASDPTPVPVATAEADAALAPAAAGGADVAASEHASPAVWGDAGARLYPYGDRIASNGEEFKPLFSLDLDFNLWLWQPWDLYFFTDGRFWGQKAGAGVTNSNQGILDFSKREFDLTLGLAWNYYGRLEARAFAYSFNNLNRGDSPVAPSGFNDGVGVENRCYLGSEYLLLGTPEFDVARASFISFGYYPSKSMVNALNNEFQPGAFARVYLVWEIMGPKLYLYTDDQFIMDSSGTPTLLTADSGMAVRPFDRCPRLEYRIGSEDTFGLSGGGTETSLYVSANLIF